MQQKNNAVTFSNWKYLMLKVRNIKKITRRILRYSASYNLAVCPFHFLKQISSCNRQITACSFRHFPSKAQLILLENRKEYWAE
jgi:hypothetical protein